LVAKAAEMGVEFIICDHHLPGESIPPATAVLNPKQADCPYPYKELSGAGIGFKLIQAYTEKEGLPYETILDYLDLVAVSIASDMVDVRGENRVLAYYGLKKLNENPSIGIQALLQDSQPGKSFSMMDIVFGIGPKINAAGRISDAKSAVKVLIERDYNTAKKLAVVLNERNHERKGLDTDITKEAVEQVENDPHFHQQKSIVLRGNDWHKGVIGIVASRMVEQYYKPTIVFSENEGMLTGSARSVRGFDIHEAIGKCSEYVAQFGGHKYAAGLSVPLEHFDAFKQSFEALVNASIEQESLVPTIEYDLELDLSRISLKTINILNQMAPFGPGNHMPVFRLNGMKSQGQPRILKEKHLKLTLGQAPLFFDAIGFGMAEHAASVKPGHAFDACVSLEENHFNGRSSLQLKLRDIKPA
jgi:single-stranded-DNA-specific exonuclease